MNLNRYTFLTEAKNKQISSVFIKTVAHPKSWGVQGFADHLRWSILRKYLEAINYFLKGMWQNLPLKWVYLVFLSINWVNVFSPEMLWTAPVIDSTNGMCEVSDAQEH